MPLTPEEYEEKYAELQAVEPGKHVTALDGTVWTRGWDDMWRSSSPIKRNTLALVSVFDPGDDNPTKTSTKSRGNAKANAPQEETPSLFG